MSNRVRTQLSVKNPYYIEPERMLELRHFVHQYDSWKRWVKDYNFKYGTVFYSGMGRDQNVHKPVEEEVERRDRFVSSIDMVDKTLCEAFNEMTNSIRNYILEAITGNKSYEWLRTMHNVPFGKDYYFRRYRKFYWLLDKVRK